MNKTNLTAEPGKHDLVVTRTFDAPRDLVFKAYTDPDIVSRWMGPSRLTMKIDKMDVRPGGAWRYTHSEEDGTEYGFRGVYHDVVAPEKVVGTFEFEGVPGHVALETTTFEDQGGKTRLTVKSVYQSVEDRDGMLQSGMEGGMNESWARLDEVLAQL
ncbi:MAG TPA: SRPBCC family protein [Chloroflexia bacterium]|nr:SRPBCC family protein [Chloroflexia bacterium]